MILEILVTLLLCLACFKLGEQVEIERVRRINQALSARLDTLRANYPQREVTP